MLFYIWRKVTEFLGDMQENGDFFRHFQFRGRGGAARVYGLEAGEGCKSTPLHLTPYTVSAPSLT